MRGTEVPINASVLRWAIDEAGYTDLDAAARELGTDPALLTAWLAGKARPKLTESKRLAARLRRPSATFLLPEPPATGRAKVAFRCPPNAERSGLTPREVRHLRETTRIQRTLSWALRELGAPTVDLPKLRISAPVVDSARLAREKLRVGIDQQQRSTSTSRALRIWREALEDAGIVVFLLPMGEDSCRGFSLHDDRAPMIAANTAWNPEARIFTLLHEYGHLLTRSDSACLEREKGKQLLEPTDSTERWCERFAAAVLLPWDAVSAYMIDRLGGRPGLQIRDLADARRVARRFRVSVTATVLRLVEEGAATWDLYRSIRRSDDAKPRGGRPPREPRTRGVVRRDEYGRRVWGVLVDAMREELFSRSEVLNFLRVADSDLERFAEERQASR